MVEVLNLEGVSFTLQRRPFAGDTQLITTHPMVNALFTVGGVEVEVEPNHYGGDSEELTRRLDVATWLMQLEPATAYPQLVQTYLKVTNKSPHAVVRVQVAEDVTFEQIGMGWQIVNHGSTFWPGLAERMTKSNLCSTVSAGVVIFGTGDECDAIYFEIENRENPIPELAALRPVILGAKE